MQPACVFKRVISDSRYHIHFSKDLWDPSELAISYSKTACSKKIQSCRILGGKVHLLISRYSERHEQTRFPYHTAQLCVWDFGVSPPRNGRLSSTFSLFFHLPRYMVSTAQLVLALKKHSRSSQQEWCPTKLYKLLQPAPRQQQQPVQLKTRSRVTDCRETQEVITVLFDRTLFSGHLEYFLKA